MRAAKKKRFQDATTKPTTDKADIIGREFYLKQNISRLKKKTYPRQIRTHDLCSPKHIRYLQAKL